MCVRHNASVCVCASVRVCNFESGCAVAARENGETGSSYLSTAAVGSLWKSYGEMSTNKQGRSYLE